MWGFRASANLLEGRAGSTPLPGDDDGGDSGAEAVHRQGRSYRKAVLLAAVVLAVALFSFVATRSPLGGTGTGLARGVTDEELEQLAENPCDGMDKADIDLLKSTMGSKDPCTPSKHKAAPEDKDEDEDGDADSEPEEEDEEEDEEKDEPATTAKPTTPEPTTTKEDPCAKFDENCAEKKCCSDPGAQCYEKEPGQGRCRKSCTPGPDPTDSTGPGDWSCAELGERSSGPDKCSDPGENCMDTHCCNGIGYQCFQKDSKWASCKASCTPGIDYTDINDEPWSCTKLGGVTPGRAPWVATKCGKNLGECTDAKCCRETDNLCYENIEGFATCLKECQSPWTCKEYGVRTPANAAEALWDSYGKVELGSWVADKCSGTEDDCSKSQCCKDMGLQCYEHEADKSATCRFECTPGVDPTSEDKAPWTCKELGLRTPGMVDMDHVKPKKVADWAKKECSGDDKDCTDSGCCTGPNMQCYRKDAKSAFCKGTCDPGALVANPWTCEKLGARTPLAEWTSPSLFCFVVMRKTGDEPMLMKGQLKKKKGIFGCDGYGVFSAGKTKWVLGEGPSGLVEVFPFKEAVVTTSRDNTAGNTELFMNVWDAVKEEGTWYKHDWSVKADPDTVLLPDRLRVELQEHTGSNVYLKNCDKKNGMKPMMFGSLEALTREAVQTYLWGASRCRELEWQSWGEDLFMGKCLDSLGTKAEANFRMLSDGNCLGVDCSGKAAAFHPKKDIASWLACLAKAEGEVISEEPTAPRASATAIATESDSADDEDDEDDEDDDAASAGDIDDILADLS